MHVSPSFFSVSIVAKSYNLRWCNNLNMHSDKNINQVLNDFILHSNDRFDFFEDDFREKNFVNIAYSFWRLSVCSRSLTGALVLSYELLLFVFLPADGTFYFRHRIYYKKHKLPFISLNPIKYNRSCFM